MLITCWMKTKSEFAARPFISQHPSEEKTMPVAWKPVSPYPDTDPPEAAEPPMSSLRPEISSSPRERGRHHGYFIARHIFAYQPWSIRLKPNRPIWPEGCPQFAIAIIVFGRFLTWRCRTIRICYRAKSLVG